MWPGDAARVEPLLLVNRAHRALDLFRPFVTPHHLKLKTEVVRLALVGFCRIEGVFEVEGTIIAVEEELEGDQPGVSFIAQAPDEEGDVLLLGVDHVEATDGVGAALEANVGAAAARERERDASNEREANIARERSKPTPKRALVSCRVDKDAQNRILGSLAYASSSKTIA